MRELPKTDCNAMQMKKIQDAATIAYNAKVKDEKASTKGNKKKPKKATLKIVNERNNNPGMIAAIMGDDEEGYGGEADDVDNTKG